MCTSSSAVGVDADAYQASHFGGWVRAPAQINPDAKASALRARHSIANAPRKQVGKYSRHPPIPSPHRRRDKVVLRLHAAACRRRIADAGKRAMPLSERPAPQSGKHTDPQSGANAVDLTGPRSQNA